MQKAKNTPHIEFLGTGTSVGIPMIGCRCAVCHSDDPRDKRLRSSIIYRAGGSSILVDTGPDLRAQCLRAGIDHIDAAILTHKHSDHIMGFDDLRAFTFANNNRLDIYVRPNMLGDLERIFPYVFAEKQFPGYLKTNPHIIDGKFTIGATEIVPLPVKHGVVETIGLFFSTPNAKSVAYISDAKSIPEETYAKIRGADILVLDGLRHKEHQTHMTISDAIAIRDELGKAELYLTHICHEISHASESARLPDGVHMAHDTLVVGL